LVVFIKWSGSLSNFEFSVLKEFRAQRFSSPTLRETNPVKCWQPLSDLPSTHLTIKLAPVDQLSAAFVDPHRTMEELGFTFSNVQLANFPSAKLKVDELFNEWISQEGGAALCAILLEAAAQYSVENEGESGEQARSSSSQPLFPRGGLFKSPKKRTQSEMLSNQNRTPEGLPNSTPPKEVPATATPAAAAIALQDAGSDSADEDHNAKGRRANFDKIPVFYIPGKKNNHLRITSDEDLLSKRLPEIEAFFKPFPAGIPIEKFVHVTKRLCGIPSFFNLPLCRRINERFGDADAGIPPPRTIGRSGRHPSGVKIKLKAFLKFWQAEVEPFDRVERFFRVIKRHDAEYIFKDDFIPFLQELLHFHPGLDFLEAHEEFQRKYALTVITRIFYTVNTSRSGKLSLREVRCSNLFNACMHVDEETDINRVVEYFSYEHFYVLYCKFFELDMDKDSKLTRSDLVKYGEHSLSDAIVDR
jgi:serine/threonine-protein phosphatase 2A regulatory subunit B''